MHGLTRDKAESIYIKQPTITTKDAPYNIEQLKGLFIPLKNIKYIGIIHNNYETKH